MADNNSKVPATEIPGVAKDDQMKQGAVTDESLEEIAGGPIYHTTGPV